MDYLVPTAMETPKWETDKTVTPVAAPSARRQGRRRVGHGRRAAGHRQRRRGRARRTSACAHIDIPITPEKVWRILKEKGVAE